MKAYKVFSPDWTCRGMQYKVGETYEMAGEPVLCDKGFHACKKAVDCFNYYTFDSKNKVAEVELIGDIVGIDGDKQATNKIKIVRELSWTEVLSLVNTGIDNTGFKNTGNGNSGNGNSGDWNSGYRNSGDWNSGNGNSGDRNSGNGNSGNGNSGYRNSGYGNSGNGNSGYGNSGNGNSGNGNSGDRNSGDRNSGYRNSGDRNSGDRNSGYWNSGDGHTGFFNSIDPEKHYLFNKLVDNKTIDQLTQSEGYMICQRFHLVKYRVRTTTNKFGDYRFMSYKKSWAVWYSRLNAREKLTVKRMPGFDSNVFYEITGVMI